jgi:hypothetical protein
LIVFTILVIIGCFNIYVDPFDVFGTNFVKPYYINPRYTKLSNFIDTKGEYSGIIMGGCVSSVLRPELASKLSGKNYYNLSTHFSHSLEPYYFLKALLEKKHSIEQVIINLESFTLGRPENDTKGFDVKVCLDPKYQGDLNMRWPPYLSNATWLEFYRPYLYSWVSLQVSLRCFKWHLDGRLPPVEEKEHGFWYWENNITSLRKDEKLNAVINIYSHYDNNHLEYRFSDTPVPDFVPLQINALKILKDLAEKNNIKVIGYMPPSWALRSHTSLHVRWQGKRSAWRARKWVDILGEFYDFALYNEQTFSVEEFLNSENHTAEIGDNILGQLFGSIKPDSCYKVTKDNIDDYVMVKTRNEYVFDNIVMPVLEKTPQFRWGEIDFRSFAKEFKY